MTGGSGWTLLIATHAVAATSAVVLGTAGVTHRPRGDLFHRRVGRLWVGCMYLVALTSFGIERLDPGHLSALHVLSAWTLVSLTAGLWAKRTGRTKAHGRWMTGTFAGLLAAAIGAVAPPPRLIPQTVVHHPVPLAVGAIATVTAAALAVSACRHLPLRRRTMVTPLPT